MKIFPIISSKIDRDFVKENGALEIDVAADILGSLSGIPLVGSLVSLGRVAINVKDWWYVKKLNRFMSEYEDIPESEVDNYLKSLEPKDYERISQFLTFTLYNAEEEDKANILGKIFRQRVLRKIDDDQMLRLISVVNRAYVEDLKHLSDYLTVSDKTDYITDSLSSLGLLQDCGNVNEVHVDGVDMTEWGATKHCLNRIGKLLYCILYKDGDYSEFEKQDVTVSSHTMGAISNDWIKENCVLPPK